MGCRIALAWLRASLSHFAGQANAIPTRGNAFISKVNSILRENGINGPVQTGLHIN
jgi:hypothetical protein